MARRAFFGLTIACLVITAVIIASGAAGETSPVKKVDIQKGLVAFVDIKSPTPAAVYLLYPVQYEKYTETGLLEGVLEFKNITWLMYPIPALLEDQTVYFVPKGDVIFNITYENIRERIDRLYRGEEQLRAGTEMLTEPGVNVVRLTPLIPGLKIRLEFSDNIAFVIAKTIDFARYRKGLKSFEQLYGDAEIKGTSNVFNFSTTDYEDLYVLIKTDSLMKMKYLIWATKESAESGC
ncbi:MAG: hypothetical protein HZA12_05655 [Nitrospirae bacterium]|nr:hypothetical protein [Nitrospirota bacterium]